MSPQEVVAILFCTYCMIGMSQTQNIVLNMDVAKMQFGGTLPKNIDVASGSNIMMYLTSLSSSVTKCSLFTPDGQTEYNMFATNLDPRVSYWHPHGETGRCGAYIKNANKHDEGYWRLRSVVNNDMKQGYSYVKFIELGSIVPKIELEEGVSLNVSLNSNEEVDYCEIDVPTLGSMWNRNCSVEIAKVEKGLEGTWDVNVGFRGKIEESNFKSSANVYGIIITKLIVVVLIL